MIAGVGALLTGLSVIAAMGHDEAAQAETEASNFAKGQNLEKLPENMKGNLVDRPADFDISKAKGINSNTSFQQSGKQIVYTNPENGSSHLLNGKDLKTLNGIRNAGSS
jgi:hypothetical protein